MKARRMLSTSVRSASEETRNNIVRRSEREHQKVFRLKLACFAIQVELFVPIYLLMER
jgi:hypothetical protein